MKRRISRALTLTAVSLLLLLGSCGPRNLYADRSIPALVGWSDAEKYIQALRWTPLGIFGLTWQALVDAGYITEDEGEWSFPVPEMSVYTVRRVIAGEEVRTDYIFRPTLFMEPEVKKAEPGMSLFPGPTISQRLITEVEMKRVLTEIKAEYPPYTKDDLDYRIRAQGKELLEGWAVLFDCFAQFDGRYDHPLATGENEVWEFLDWQGRPNELEDIHAAVKKGWKLSYSVRCSPVTVGDCLTPEELETLADLAVEKGWAVDLEAGLDLFRNWHLAAMVGKNVPGNWTLNGTGIALYLTRPGANGDGSH